MKPLPEAAEFASLREKHEHEWPADVKEAAARFAANLTTAHTKSFQSSPVMVNGMAQDWADFLEKLDVWNWTCRLAGKSPGSTPRGDPPE